MKYSVNFIVLLNFKIKNGALRNALYFELITT